MARTNVVVDLTDLIRARGFDDISYIIKQRCGEKIFDQLDELQQALEEATSDLGFFERRIRSKMTKADFDKGGIMDQLMDVLKINDMDNDNSINLMSSLFNNDQILNDSDLAEDLIQYIHLYDKAYALTINSITNLDKISQTIRGDTQLYTIGLGAKKQLREAILNIDQMHKFMAQRDKFMLAYDEKTQQYGFQLRNDLNKTKMATGLAQALGQNLQGQAALNYFNIDNAITLKIWNVLQKTDIYSSASINRFSKTSNMEELVKIGAHRKYEILHMGIWESLYTKSAEDISNSMITDIITKQFGSAKYNIAGELIGFSAGLKGTGFELENIAGFAKGDSLMRVLQGENSLNLSTQQKYFGGGKGFKMESLTTIFNGLNFWKNEEQLQSISSDMQTELFESGALDNDIFNAIDDYSGFLTYEQSSMYKDWSGGMNYSEDSGFSFSEDINLVFDA